MSLRTLIHWSGPVAMLGGLLWIVGAVVTALQREGCVGTDCYLPGRSMRAGTTLGAALFIAAVPLIGLGVVAVVIRAGRAGRFRRLGHIGLLGSVVGVALLLTGLLVQASLLGGDFPYMPLVVIAGGPPLVIGTLLVGIAILRVGVLPRWSGALLILGTLALPEVNDQNAQVSMAIPFGIAWLGGGYALWSAPGEQPVQVQRLRWERTRR